MLLTALGTLPFALDTGDGVLLGAALLVRGLGMSAANLALLVGAFRDLAPEDVPHAGSITRVLQQVGGSFGTAVLAVLLRRGAGTATAFAHAFAWTAGLTVVACAVALCLPTRVAVAQPAS